MNQINETDVITQELQARSSLRLGRKFEMQTPPTTKKFHILTSSCDEGVIRNGGRRGTSLAPEAILNSFKGLIAPAGEYHFLQSELCPSNDTFDLAQEKSYKSWMSMIPELQTAHNSFVHLGGGHDHIYPLLRALDSLKSRLTIFNVDAHTDTRTDKWAHSGTPFRQFANTAKNPFTLYQYGAHPYSNVSANFTPLGKGQMKMFWRDSTTIELTTSFKKYFEDCDIAVFSLDADALDGSDMEAVSAVNPDGFTKREIRPMFDAFKLCSAPLKIFGIYEYNPLFDNLSQKGQRYLASLIYHLFF